MTNVMIAEDEADASSLYRQQFRKDVRNVAMNLPIVMSGLEALKMLEKINRERPLIILSDINLPPDSVFIKIENETIKNICC